MITLERKVLKKKTPGYFLKVFAYTQSGFELNEKKAQEDKLSRPVHGHMVHYKHFKIKIYCSV